MKRSHVVILALSLWIVLIGAVTVRVGVSKPTSQTVMPIYRAAGERWIAGESLYEPAPPHDTFRYPPGFAALFAPFASLPEKVVAIGWRWIGIAVFLVGLWQFCRVVKPNSFPLVAALCIPLVLGSFNNGQVNVAIIGFVLFGVAAAAKEQFTWSALWLSLAIGMKLYPLAPALLLVMLVPRSLGWRLALGTAIVLILPFLLQDPRYVWQQHLDLVEWMQRDDRLHTWALERVPRDWTVLTRTWLGYVPGSLTVKLVSALSGVAFAGIVWWSKRKRGVAFTWPVALSLGGIWMTLFGPATESVTYCLIAPAAGWLLATSRGWSLGIATAGYLLHLSPVIRDIFPNSWTYSVYGPQAAGTILLLFATMVRVMSVRKSETQSETRSQSIGLITATSIRSTP